MEVMLAVAVLGAVAFFGALISLGNERQKRAIDQLREQATLWAIQDLQMKRERFAHDIRIDDPRDWLNNLAGRLSGYDLNLQVVESFDAPEALYCLSADGQHKMIFTTLSPSDVDALRKVKQNRLGKSLGHNPLLSLPKRFASEELSTLNSGILFDLEMMFVWKELTGKRLHSKNRFWVYRYS